MYLANKKGSTNVEPFLFVIDVINQPIPPRNAPATSAISASGQ